MNDSAASCAAHGGHGRRLARTAAAVIAAAALALLAAACSGSPVIRRLRRLTGCGRVSDSPSAVAFSDCIRSHGVPNFPDPASNGELPKASPQQLGVSSSRFQAAQRACQHLLPTRRVAPAAKPAMLLTGDCPQALVRRC